MHREELQRHRKCQQRDAKQSHGNKLVKKRHNMRTERSKTTKTAKCKEMQNNKKKDKRHRKLSDMRKTHR